MKAIDSYYIRHFCQLPKRRLEWRSMPGRDVLDCVQFCGHLLPDRRRASTDNYEIQLCSEVRHAPAETGLLHATL